jgi:hypothetical protein
MHFVRRIDAHVFALFVVISSLVYLFGYHFLLDHESQPYLAKLHAIVIIYGSAQSFFGFVAGYCIAKCWYSEHAPSPPVDYDVLLSDLS